MAIDDLTEEQARLYHLMSDISERAYFARWMDGTEYRLRAFVSNRHDDGDRGGLLLTPAMRSDLLTLSEHLCGWLRWVDEITLRAGAGVQFVRRAEWERHYSRWVAGNNGAFPA